MTKKTYSELFRIGLSVCAIAASLLGIRARADVSFGLNAGVTDRGVSDGSGLTGVLGYPVIGINLVAHGKNVQFRNYLEYQGFKANSATGVQTNNIYSFVSMPSLSLGMIYLGVGGGFGYEAMGSNHTATPWLAAALGVDLGKMFFMEARYQADLGTAAFGTQAYYMLQFGMYLMR